MQGEWRQRAGSPTDGWRARLLHEAEAPTAGGLAYAMRKHFHAIGFDDAPFERTHRGDVAVVGAVYSRLLLEGVLIGRVRRDGANAARSLARVLRSSRWSEHVQLILLQGIALAGFSSRSAGGACGLPPARAWPSP